MQNTPVQRFVTYCYFVLITFVPSYFVATSCAGQPWRDAAASLLAQHCSDCHADGASEGGLDLDSLSDDLNDAETFAMVVRIVDRIRNGEMPPPEDADPIPAEQRREFASTMHPILSDAGRKTNSTVLRRLNRIEYQNTVNDIFGTDLNLSRMLPEDGRSHEFDNVGEALGISMVHLQRYLDAIDSVMDAAIARSSEPPPVETIRASYADTREAEKFIGSVWKKLDDGSVVFFADLGYPSGMLRGTDVKTPGWYKVRVTGYAYQTQRNITFRIGGTSFAPGSEKPTYGYFSFPPLSRSGGQPTTVETNVWIEQRYMVTIDPWGLVVNDYNLRKEGANNYPGAGLAIQSVELVGPIVESFPSIGHQLIYDGLNRIEMEPTRPSDKKKPWYVPKFQIETDVPTEDACGVLARVARVAFRRNVSDEDVQTFVDLFDRERQSGSDADTALRSSVAAIFCSPDFLFFRESPGWLDDHALATRLSYFLTRTTPDESLLADADAGTLSTDARVLLGHVRRLIDGPHHQRFVTDFTDAWLNLRDIEDTAPDQKLFPEYDTFLQESAILETRAFFRELIAGDLPVRNVVKSDFAMLNNRLAKHYRIGLGEIESVDGPEIRRVAIPPDSVRGGLISHASVLKVSANGTNTSPVVRGVWMMERILGQAPPPPPPGIAGVEPDIRGASTLRELLDKHRDLDTCRSCHAMIDPPGFALENFNPIGGYRERFRSLGAGHKLSKEVNGRQVQYRLGPPVDSSGDLVGHGRFANFVQFRDLLAANEDLLAKALITKLLTFATGREMGYADRESIDELVQSSRANRHGVRGMIELVVTSEAFRKK